MAFPLTYQPQVVPSSATNPPAVTTTNGGGGSGTTVQPTTTNSATNDGGSTSIGSSTTNTCTSPCLTCRLGMPTTCYSCVEGFTLFGSICLEKTNDININWGTSAQDGDIQYIDGGMTGLNQLIDNGHIDPTGGIDGSAAAHLTGTSDSSTRISFTRIEKSFVKFELTAWFKPNPTANHNGNARFFTFTDGSSRRISVSLEDPDVNNNPHMIIEFLNAPPLRCNTEVSITSGEWNQFILKMSAGSVECCIEGTCIGAAYEGASEESLNFVLQEWYLGDTQNGIIGHVDGIKLSITENLIPSVPKKTLITAVVFILLFGIIGVIGFKYRSDFLNPCGGDSHDRTVNGSSSKSPAINVSYSQNNTPSSSSSWFSAKPAEGSGAPPPAPGSRGPPPKPNTLPTAPPLAQKSSFRQQPPRAPIKPSGMPPKRQVGGTNRPGLPTIKSSTPKRPGLPPKRTFPRKPANK